MTFSVRDLKGIPEPLSQEINFEWGLDQVTPSRRVKPGLLRASQNIEIDINGGYLWPTGYEIFDGSDAPSDATYTVLDVTITGTFSAGDTVTGATTGATGVIVVGGVVTSGTQDYLVLAKVTGTFSNASEDLTVSAAVQGNTDAIGVVGGASTPLLDAQFTNLAADVIRADVGVVPGTGQILGVWLLDDIVYGWRNATSSGTVSLDSGASGSVTGITVNSVGIMSGTVSFTTDLATTAGLVAANINANTSSPNYTATAVNAVITIRALVDNSFTVVSSTTTIVTTDVSMSGHGLSAEIYKSSSAGWTLVPLGFELSFTSGGTTTISDGDTITGLTSGATAAVTRVMLQSGTFAAGTAAGRFIFASQTGTFVAENIEVSSSGDLGTIAGDSSAITLLPSGRYELITNNFGGSLGVDRIYGADGVNRGFEFDGTIFAPIDSTSTTDTPLHVVAFKNHLFFSFSGSAQFSGIGEPFIWSPILGAGELALGDTITAFSEQPSAAPPTTSQSAASLTIFSSNRIHVLYGSSSANWDLAPFRREMGGISYSVQEFGVTLMMDERGIATLNTSQKFGNFDRNTITRMIQPFVNSKKTLVTASSISRTKSQYRIYFSDNTGIYITMDNQKVTGLGPVLLADIMRVMCSIENNSGSEEIYAGSDNGFVFQMEKGTSHNGDEIEVIGSTHFIHSNRPRREKHYQDVSFEISGSGYAEFDYAYELGYNTTDIPQASSVSKVTEFSSVFWDNFTWDNFTWDGETISPTQVDMDGTAENVSHIFKSNSDYFSPIIMSGIIQHFLWGVELRS